MRLSRVRPTLAAAAAMVVFAAALSLLGGGGTPASAAQVIDASSCGGVGYPNCANLPANVTIGANSCTVLNACDDLGDGVVIGAGSCTATDACSEAGASSSGGTGFARIGNGSCTTYYSCYEVGYGDAGSASVTIGDNACGGDQYACEYVGYAYVSADVTIGDGSCNGYYACYEAYDGVIVIGENSCNGYEACYIAGYGGDAHIGDDSCNAASGYACMYLGYEGSATVGDDSCNGYEACYYGGYEGTVEVGDGSCSDVATDDYPCYELAYYGEATVGDGSCLGEYACYEAGYYGSVSIGSNSCIGSSYACGYPGYSNYDDPDYPGQSAVASIGDDSCHGYYACYMYYGHQTIGDGSCNGEYACNYLATSDPVGGDDDLVLDTATVGDNSCNGDGACDSGSDGGSGSVGDSSCNQDGQYDAQCNGPTMNVGDCLYNDIPICSIEASVTVKKVFTDHSNHTVQVRLECPEATSVHANGTQSLGDGKSVTYDIEFTGESVRCTVSESGVSGYLPTTSCSGDATVRRASLSFDLDRSGSVHCTFTNSPTEEDTSSGGGGGGNGNGSGAPTCTNGILTGNRPPAAGGFGTFAFCGGTFPALLTASGCPQATAVFFYNKPDGSFASWIPAAEVAAANEAIQALFASTIPAGTIFTARCV